MSIFSLYKWFVVIFTEIIILIFCFLLVFSLVDYQAPINEHEKTCIVTGASSGIGLEISRQMVTRGWRVIGVGRREDKLKDLARDLGIKFVPYVCDVSNEEKVREVSNDMRIKNFQPTLFFLNAGMGHADLKFKFSQKLHKETFNTNYFGIISWVEQWLNDVKNYGGGTFVATSSVSSLYAVPGAASYSASKAAINTCFQSLRLQYIDDNIGFFVVLPGPVDTTMLKGPAKNMPFIHKPKDDAAYIIEKVFKCNKQIEPSWFYAFAMRMFNLLPDKIALRILS